jgi:hypothetical protein
MEFRVRLVHADSQHRVVRVEAFDGDRSLGSALGEAESAEVAEDRAMDRLRQRLRFGDGAAVSPPPPPPRQARPPRSEAFHPGSGARLAGPVASETGQDFGAVPPSESEEPVEAPVDPEDWSADLSQLDALCRQLGWGREEERVFMQRLFGHPSRSRLTRYADLQVLRRALEALPPNSRPETAPLPMLRSELLSQCDGLLARLGWTTDQARQSLEAHFSVNSRQRLSDVQLLAFNLTLESELLNAAAAVETQTVAQDQRLFKMDREREEACTP